MKYYISFQAGLWSGPIFGSFYAECDALNEETIETWRNNIADKTAAKKDTIIFLAIQKLEEDSEQKKD